MSRDEFLDLQNDPSRLEHAGQQGEHLEVALVSPT